ncbi:CRISPR-associated protein Cas6 [Marinithermus hydrothermalis DSM 14884]|uniref:CRISPR-associated endoribonuclease n=1 Tax=Marinithermus hydrothermalis (strain DSM 14884 / JCM 11576 / T1) TaxID=869210 RepID=F2NN51_MARHT|nr:CRISPR-associated protein Cas6 [Marinithermus hydrothermalis DSM 14884]
MVHQVTVWLRPSEPVLLPFTYREELQGLVYRRLPEKLSRWLHDEGLPTQRGRFKPFVFSRLTGKLRPQPAFKALLATGPVAFHLASPLPEVAQGFAQGLLTQPRVRLHKARFTLEELTLSEVPLPQTPALLEARAPITVYRKENGQRRYYTPFEPEFAALVLENLRAKAQALNRETSGTLHLEPVGVTPRHKKIERFRRMIIEGWMGRYRLTAPPEILWVALTAGLGALGSQGFGYVEVVS